MSGGLPVHCQMFSSISSLCPLVASSSPSPTQSWQSQMSSDIARCHPGGGENYLQLKTTALCIHLPPCTIAIVYHRLSSGVGNHSKLPCNSQAQNNLGSLRGQPQGRLCDRAQFYPLQVPPHTWPHAALPSPSQSALSHSVTSHQPSHTQFEFNF